MIPSFNKGRFSVNAMVIDHIADHTCMRHCPSIVAVLKTHHTMSYVIIHRAAAA